MENCRDRLGEFSNMLLDMENLENSAIGTGWENSAVCYWIWRIWAEKELELPFRIKY